MANEQQLQQLEENARAIVATPIPELVANPAKWGSLNFEGARADLEIIFGIAHELLELTFRILPEPNAQQIIAHLIKAREVVSQISSFAIETANAPSQQRDQIVGAVKAAAMDLLVSASYWIPFLAYQKGDVQKNIEAMANAATQINEALKGAKANIVDKEAELKTIIDAAREASAVAGVGVFTQDFATQADSLEITAKKWLRITACAAGISLIAAVASMFVHVGSDSPAAITQFITSKLVALVILVSATVWCGRIYKATMHQAVSNRHRAHALRTFQAFTQAASDEPTRNAVLLESTRSVFAIGPSGYLDTAEPSADPGTKVLEIIKGATAKG